MTPKEAEKIINSYWKSYKSLSIYAVQPISDLPCSPGKIRYAHLVYGEELIKRGLMKESDARRIGSSYAEIHIRFVEKPKLINDKLKKYMKGLNKGVKSKKYHTFFLKRAHEALTLEIEYNNFLADCQGNL